MKALMLKCGVFFAVIGFLFCAVAGITRLLGNFSIMQFEMITFLQAGIALMVSACVIKLYCSD